MRSILRVLLVILGASLATACKGLGDMTSPRPVETPVSSVVLSTEQLTLGEGSSVALQVTVLDADNRPVTDRPVFWSSSDSTLARVSTAGLVTALRAGNVQIAASVDGRSAVARLTITARGVASVQVTPTTPSLLKGGFVQLTARTLDETGALLTDRPVFWGTSDPTVAVVDVTGMVTGIAPGVATVTATSESRAAAVGVTVSPVPVASVQLTPTRDSVVLGQATQLTATPRDSTGARLDDPVTFSTSAAGIATVSSTGLVLGISPGTATITASSGGRSATATIMVQPRPVGAVIVSPAHSALTVGQSVRLTVQITDGSGNLLTGRPVGFSSSNVNVAQVAADGTVTVTAPGTATITASSEGKTGTATVTVAPSPIASLRIDPSNEALLVGGSARLSVVALDAGGNVLAQRPVTWTSGAPTVVSVSTDGLVNAIGPGIAIIFAAAEGRIATSTIAVTAITASTVVVAPAVATIIAGQSLDFTATLRDGAGQVITGRAVQWFSTSSPVAIVSSTGRVRGVSPGIARVDATVDGVTGSSNVTVIPVPIVTVSVNLVAASIIVGQTTQASAVARDSIGGVLTGRLVTWTSSNAAVATVSSAGAVTAVALGTTNIIATSEGKTGQATLSVVVGSPTTLAANSAIAQSGTAGAAVTTPPSVKVTDAGGTPVAGVGVTFTVTGGGGTISPTSPATVTTNANGIATLTSWTLGAVAGANTLTAAVSGLTGSPVAFSATGIVGAPTTIVANSVTSQSTTAGTAVVAPPSVKVTDAVGNPVGGVIVTFTRTVGGGTISPTSPASVSTNAGGIATLASWTLGTVAGANIVTATVAGLSGSPVTFNATGTVGAPSAIAANSVTTQSAQAGTSVPAPPSVKVTDAVGNAVSGVSVTFTLASGGGTTSPASPATIITNASGIATLTSWKLGVTAGANTVTAAAAGLAGSPVTFTASGTVGAPTTIAANSVTTQSATAGSTVAAPPSVRVTDVGNNPVSGVSVTFTVTAGGGALSPASPAVVTTNASGIATLTSWTLGVTAGANTVSAVAAGLAGSPVIFAATGTVGAATQLVLTTQPSGAVTGVAFVTQPVLEIRDANGNRTNSTAAVTATIATGPGALSGTATVNAVNGTATFADLAITGPGAHTLQFTTISPALSSTSSSFNVTAGAPTTIVANSVTAQSATAGTAVSVPPSVKVTDAGGNPVSGVSVTFTRTVGSGTLVPASPASVSTNASGVATLTSWTLGATAGANTVTAAVAGLAGSPVTFNATGTVGAAVAIGASSVTSQSATAGALVTAPPTVTVTDAGGNGVSGVSVTFTLTAGGGSTVPASPATVITNASGIATLTSWTLGVAAGANTVTAAAAGLTGSPITFTATGTVGTPTTIVSNSATTQSATVLTAVSAPPSVKVTDVGGNPVSGVSVTFTVTGGAGTTSPASPAVVSTNASGIATLTSWTLGATAGSNTVTATAAGLAGSPVTFTATGTAGVATTLIANSATTQSAVAGAAVTAPPSVKVTDAGGNGVSGVTVTFTVTGGAGTTSPASPASVVSNASGVATLTSWTLGVAAGANTVSAAAAGLAGSPVTFTATGTAGAPTTIASNSVTSQSATSGSAVSAPPSVTVTDAGGNPVSGVSVTFTVTGGGGTISPTSPAVVSTNASGIATLTAWTLGATAGANTVTAAAAGLAGSPVTFSATGTAGAAAQLAITTQPAGAVSGANFTTQPVVAIRDAGNNLVNSTAAVTVAIASGTGTLTGTTTVNAVAGVATFTNLEIAGSGAHTLTFTSAGLTSATSTSFTVTQVAASLAVQTQPAGAVSGVAFTTQPVVQILDNAGLVVTTGSGASEVVTASIATGTGTMSGTLTATAVNGVATFTTLAITGGGAHTLQFTTTTPTLAVTSASFTLSAGAATQLAITTSPAGAVSGVVLTTQPVIAIRDAGNNLVNSTAAVTVAIASGTGTLTGTTTVNAVGGVATFTDLQIAGSGAHTLTFTSAGLSAATSGSFTVTQTAASLLVQTQPAGAVSGVAFTTQPVVQILDNAGLVVTTGSGATEVVTAAIASGTGSLSGTLTATAVNGVATFATLAITGAGAHTLQFTTTTPTLAVTSASFTLGAGAATQLALTTPPAGAVSGVVLTTQPVIELRDAGGVLTSSTAAVTVAIASGTGTLSGTTTVNAVGGVTTFTDLQIAGSGAHTLTFTSGALTAATSGSFTVTQTAASLLVQTQPAGAVSGAAFTTQPVVRIRDNAGLVVTTGSGATLTVTAAIASGTGTLGGTLTATAVNGVATFTDLALTGAGAHTLQFTTVTPALSVASSSFTVAAGAPTTIAAQSSTTQSATVGAPVAAPPSVKVTDAGGNAVSGVDVTFAVASGGGTIAPAGPAVVSTNASGLATLTAWTLGATAGANTVTATATGLTGSPVLFSATGTVGAATQLVLTTQPAGAVSGMALTTQPVLEIRDANGNLTTSTVAVTVALASGGGALTGTLTVNAVAGVATFTDLQMAGPGAHTLTFTAGGLTAATSNAFTVTQVAASLVVQTQPVGAASGVVLATQPVVRILDNAGVVVTTGTGATLAVTVSITSGPGALSGTMTVNAVGGVATFTNLVITGAGDHTLKMETTTPALSVTSGTVTVTP